MSSLISTVVCSDPGTMESIYEQSFSIFYCILSPYCTCVNFPLSVQHFYFYTNCKLILWVIASPVFSVSAHLGIASSVAPCSSLLSLQSSITLSSGSLSSVGDSADVFMLHAASLPLSAEKSDTLELSSAWFSLSLQDILGTEKWKK